MFLIYGANGYTAQLMLPLLHQFGLQPILAGRSAEKIKPLAETYGLEYRAFNLNDPAAVDAGLAGCTVVLHCAGPFIHTAKPMIEGCLRQKAHYLDITGEIAIFEMAAAKSEQAKERGIMLMPGTGFDVVPTDCLARQLHEQLPDATHLTMAFAPSGGGISHGTAMTMAEGLGEGGLKRENGVIVKVPLGHRAETIDFGPVQKFCMAIPWGDVSTAFYTTGIPNIEVLSLSNPKTHTRMVRWQWLLNWFLRTNIAKNRLRSAIKNRPAGPSEERRASAKTYLWGEVHNAKGDSREIRRTTAEGYTLTAHSALLIAKKALNGEFKPGFCTPAGLYGTGLLDQAEQAIQ